MLKRSFQKIALLGVLFCLTFIFGSSPALSNERSYRWIDRYFSHKRNFKFVGYWEGIDPLDGAISNLSITYETDIASQVSNGRSRPKGVYRIVSASLGFVLFCDGEPGFSRGSAVRDGNKLVSDDRVIICLDDDLVTENQSPVEINSDSNNDTVILTFPDASRDPIVFHRLSR